MRAVCVGTRRYFAPHFLTLDRHQDFVAGAAARKKFNMRQEFERMYDFLQLFLPLRRGDKPTSIIRVNQLVDELAVARDKHAVLGPDARKEGMVVLAPGDHAVEPEEAEPLSQFAEHAVCKECWMARGRHYLRFDPSMRGARI